MPVEQHSDPFEETLAAGLREAGDTFTTDRAALVAAGSVRGRRHLLLRRAAVTGGAAGIALVGVGGALLLPDAGTTLQNQASATSPVSTTATPGKDTRALTTGASLAKSLEALLPKGEFDQTATWGVNGSSAFTGIVYDDGKGASAIGLSIGRVDPASEEAAQLTQCPGKALTHYDACRTEQLADGSRLMIYQGYEYPDRRVDTKWWSAELVTPQGKHVNVEEWNAAAEKDSPITRPQPPLSPAQLKKVVTASVWRDAVDSLPKSSAKPTTPSSPTTPVVEGKPVTSTLKSLLPKGFKVTGTGPADDTEFGYLVVDDGKGKTFVQVNVQPDMSDAADDLFGTGSDTLPDGTKVAERQGPGEKGGSGVVMWTVDTMRPDGRRVVISAFNSGAQDTPATRATPALTMKQLRAIALSTEWL
ncbi:hypothetical protein [Streptomyces pseudovenezuelae]|uniref:Serine/threonine protein kinase n=1 Tax=Streptomyces pseudovenezuelae TaxID=67350 RepID=A0ABT6LV97_9ACTN|nr:hypothetical protein [Streptomyces pseudovenezuelae]MDH6220238.1 hypothetical protein [Streptomyces pseudovenezuelae]